MKPLYLLDYQGNVRPGRATLETITDVLEGRESDRLATVLIVDGAIIVTRLDAAALDDLRVGLTERRRDALRTALDHALALIRSVDGVPGVRASSYYSGVVSIDVGDSPWAEAVALAWAEEHALHVSGEPPPSKAGPWSRRANLQISPDQYAHVVATLSWPTIVVTDAELVARDADEAGRPDVAAHLRQSIPVVAIEESF